MNLPALLALALCASCSEYVNEIPYPDRPDKGDMSLSEIAGIIASLPLETGHLDEVYDAVASSSANGYDEEYMMSDLFESPGAGVGDTRTRASAYGRPLRDLFKDYLNDRALTRGGSAEVEDYIRRLAESDIQIYWPYSENWDGKSFPIVTFDPGYGADSNYGYVIKPGGDGKAFVSDSVFVDEKVAMERPVWVINTNDDSKLKPMLISDDEAVVKSSGGEEGKTRLILKSISMLRNYDSWFGGASEFWIKIGAVDGFKASDDKDLLLYSPSVTDFFIVIKRKQMGLSVPVNSIMLTDFTDQMEKLAFLVTEDDGGEMTNWKASVVVKYNSKQYGFDVTIPYKDKDDIVWRGTLDASFFKKDAVTSGRFGDVKLYFELR